MPIEIKELHIKAVVSNSSNQTVATVNNIDLAKLKKEMVKQCVDEVLQKLKAKNER